MAIQNRSEPPVTRIANPNCLSPWNAIVSRAPDHPDKSPVPLEQSLWNGPCLQPRKPRKTRNADEESSCGSHAMVLEDRPRYPPPLQSVCPPGTLLEPSKVSVPGEHRPLGTPVTKHLSPRNSRDSILSVT